MAVGSGTTVLIFRAAGHYCAIRSEWIVELTLMPHLLRLPAQPALLDGFFNFRGTPLAVMPLHRLFQLNAPEPGIYLPLLVVRTSRGLLALRADSLEEVTTVDHDSAVPCTDQSTLNDCAELQFEWQDREVALLAPERLLLFQEQACVADLQEQAQYRLKELEDSFG